MSKLTRLRPLGAMEQYSSSRNILHITGRVINITRYRLPHSFPQISLKKHVTYSLIYLALREDYLRVTVVDEDSSTPMFASVSDLDIDDHLSWQTVPGHLGTYEETLFGPDGLIQAELDTNWPSDLSTVKPPWCVKVYSPDPSTEPETGRFIDVAFSAHHAVCDGISGRSFHAALVSALSRPVDSFEEQSTKLCFPEPATVHGSQETLIEFRSSMPYFTRLLWSEFAPSWLQRKPAPTWTGPTIDIHRQMVSGFRLVKLPAQSTSRVLDKCRKHNTTLTALLHTLVLKSLLGTVKKLQIPGAEVRACTAIDLRRLLPPQIPRDTLGDYVTALTHNFTSTDIATLRGSDLESGTTSRSTSVDTLGEEVWKVSAAVKSDMNAQMQSLPADNVAGLLSWVSDFRGRCHVKHGQQRDETWELSNLGVMDAAIKPNVQLPTDNYFKLEQTVFTQSGMVMGPALGISVAGVKGGIISVSITWQRHDDVDIAAEEVTRDLASWLRDNK
ncbi:hypothetical protein BROUX41_005700 [Berkeleyomyces rouxiae]|uniref:uncharacterized protein n=1 Tax=Berkeleyomyces rouxiae TaxID=2035830 RepID=UPI003B7CE206